jgi:hypothetical protein
MDERKAWVIGTAVVLVAIVACVAIAAYFSYEADIFNHLHPLYTTCVN